MPWSCITGSYGNSILSFWSILHTAFHSGCTSLHFQQQCIKVPVSSHAHQNLLLLLPLIMTIITGIIWNLSVFNCIFFTTWEIEHFMCLLAICTTFFEKSLLNSCTISPPRYWFFGGWDFSVPYRFWILVPYQRSSWQRFFSHSVCYLMSLVTFFFAVQTCFNLMQSHVHSFS
jgi:hypothetical protein